MRCDCNDAGCPNALPHTSHKVWCCFDYNRFEVHGQQNRNLLHHLHVFWSCNGFRLTCVCICSLKAVLRFNTRSHSMHWKSGRFKCRFLCSSNVAYSSNSTPQQSHSNGGSISSKCLCVFIWFYTSSMKWRMISREKIQHIFISLSTYLQGMRE